MQEVLSVDNMRDSDATTIAGGISGTELMMRAGRAIYDAVENEYGWRSKVLIICGSGNNAGDGYVLAGLLNAAGIKCEILLVENKFSNDGFYYYRQCIDKRIKTLGYFNGNTEVILNSLPDYEIIVDCIYGTGFHGKVRDDVAKLIKAVNAVASHPTPNNVYVVSVDINSGLNGANGQGECCIHSDLTVSVGNYQPGHFLGRAKDVMKKKINCPIGIAPVRRPYYLFEKSDAAECFAERENNSNKGTYGYIALIGGSARYSGAIRLAFIANAAMRSGAGVVSVAVPKGIANVASAQVLESTIFPLADNDGEMVFDRGQFEELIRYKKAIAIGMGIGRTSETAKAVEYLLNEYTGLLIIDADGISDVSDIGIQCLKNTDAKVVLTPHPKEFSRLIGRSVDEILENPIELAREFAWDNHCTVLLKGPTTIVTDGNEVILVDRGCAGMATAGSGDVLSGIAAAVCAANSGEIVRRVATAAYVNGLAGELAQESSGSISMIASDTVAHIAGAVKEICGI